MAQLNFCDDSSQIEFLDFMYLSNNGEIDRQQSRCHAHRASKHLNQCLQDCQVRRRSDQAAFGVYYRQQTETEYTGACPSQLLHSHEPQSVREPPQRLSNQMVATPAELVNHPADFAVARWEFDRGRRGTRVVFGSQAELLAAEARSERQQHHNRGSARSGSVYK